MQASAETGERKQETRDPRVHPSFLRVGKVLIVCAVLGAVLYLGRDGHRHLGPELEATKPFVHIQPREGGWDFTNLEAKEWPRGTVFRLQTTGPGEFKYVYPIQVAPKEKITVGLDAFVTAEGVRFDGTMVATGLAIEVPNGTRTWFDLARMER